MHIYINFLYSFIGWCIEEWKSLNNQTEDEALRYFDTKNQLKSINKIKEQREKATIYTKKAKQSGKTTKNGCGDGETINPIPKYSTTQQKFNRRCLRERYDVY